MSWRRQCAPSRPAPRTSRHNRRNSTPRCDRGAVGPRWKTAAMAIDFTFEPAVEEARLRMRAFVDDDVRPAEERLSEEGAGRGDWRAELDRLRHRARDLDLWMPHMPKEWGGVGLGPTALAAVSAESSKARWASYVVNCYAPDEGNMHTLLHWGTDDQ